MTFQYIQQQLLCNCNIKHIKKVIQKKNTNHFNLKNMSFRQVASFLLYFLILHNTEGLRKFWKGRRDGGNLGHPSIHNHTVQLPPDEWFVQNLDHFDPTNNNTWNQRYFVNDQFYKDGGPVFLMIGGEGEATAKWMIQGAWIKYAQKYGAICFQLEHRFYGKSHPTKDLSTKNLVYLSSEQSLADLAYFITAMNEKFKLKANTKWIAFGGSYPGSLAAWLREKYPHLVHGSISSSGPLFAKLDFKEYFEIVTQSLGTYSNDCVESVRKGISQVEILTRHMIGQRSLNEKFKLCDPIEQSVDNIYDMSSLFESLADNFAGIVQYNKDNSPHATITIDTICDIMTNKQIGPPVSRLAAVNTLLLSKNKEKCLEYKYNSMIEEMRNISWNSDVSNGTRQWTYQTCTEFGFYQTSDVTSIFGNNFPVNFFVKQCSDIFGPRFNSNFLTRSIYRTNIYYGGFNPETTNVLFVHGSVDPWHALGIINNNVSTLPSIYIEGTAHCANMYEPRDEDLPQLKAARVKIDNYIGNLLKQTS